MRLIAFALFAAATSACGSATAQHAPAANAGPIIRPILRSNQTNSGQPLRLPQGEAELVAVTVDIPAGGVIALHRHPWSRFAYVDRGSVRVINRDTGASIDFQSGQVIIEAVDHWHEGRAVGGPVRLVVFDLVPPGESNMVASTSPRP